METKADEKDILQNLAGALSLIIQPGDAGSARLRRSQPIYCPLRAAKPRVIWRSAFENIRTIDYRVAFSTQLRPVLPRRQSAHRRAPAPGLFLLRSWRSKFSCGPGA